MPDASKQLLGKGSIYTLATAAPMLTGVLITPVLTRSIDPTGYGLIQSSIVWMNMVTSVLAMGLPQIITRNSFLADDREAGSRGLVQIGSAVGVPLAFCCAAIFGIFQYVGFFPQGPTYLLASVAGGAGATVALCQALAVARGTSYIYVGLAFGVSVFTPAIGLVAVRWLNGGAFGYFISVVVVFYLTMLIGLVLSSRSGTSVRSWRSFGRALKMSLPLIPHQLSVTLALGMNVLLAGLLFDDATSARAQLALLLASVPIVIISAISSAWTPVVLSVPEEERGARLTETAREVAWIAALGSGALALLSPLFFSFLAPGSYDTHLAIPLTAVASLAAVITAVYQADSQAVFASGKTFGLAVLSPLSLVLGLTCGALLTPFLGLAALGVGYVTTYLLLWLSMRWIANRSKTIKWSAKVAVLPALVAVVGAALGGTLSLNPTDLLIRVGLAALLLGLAAIRMVRAIWGGRKSAATTDQ